MRRAITVGEIAGRMTMLEFGCPDASGSGEGRRSHPFRLRPQLSDSGQRDWRRSERAEVDAHHSTLLCAVEPDRPSRVAAGPPP